MTPTAADAAPTALPTAVGDLIDRTTSPAQRHGVFAQQAQRGHEDALRRRAAAVGRHLLGRGWTWARIADLIQVAGRTLRHWRFHLLDRLRPACPLGRPVVRSPRIARNEVIDRLDELGPQVGLPTLRACFPALSRAELDDLLSRYRRVWRERHRQPLRMLHWPVPGRVWAIDFAEPPTPLEGRDSYLLAVRDLASGMPLLWRPVEAATAVQAADGLAGLFAEQGPPLVLKSDNGAHFTGDAVRDLLTTHRVEHLLSPPHWPRYNGSIEAGIGALKERTAARAARGGHPGSWTWEDAAGALHEAAELARPRGPSGPSPAELWEARTPIADAERAAFRAAVGRQNACRPIVDGIWSHREMARTAIRHALEECGYLLYRRRSILPPINGPKTASIP